MNKTVVKAWMFKSGSLGKFYQTLQYSDGTTSCDCKGWTLRCKNGQRMCKHTRSVDMQMADRQCAGKTEYASKNSGLKAVEQGTRRFDFAA